MADPQGMTDAALLEQLRGIRPELMTPEQRAMAIRLGLINIGGPLTRQQNLAPAGPRYNSYPPVILGIRG